MVGDCQAIIDGKLYENGKPYEEKIARKRVELIEQGLSPAEARKQIEPLLIEARRYWCILSPTTLNASTTSLPLRAWWKGTKASMTVLTYDLGYKIMLLNSCKS